MWGRGLRMRGFWLRRNPVRWARFVRFCAPRMRRWPFRPLRPRSERSRPQNPTGCFPSGMIATEYTHFVCPFNSARHSPVSRSQILTVLSREPDIAYVPSGLTATLCTQPMCPVSFRSSTASSGFDSACAFAFRSCHLGACCGASAYDRQADSSSSNAACASSRKSTYL
jgi:hypothetical protein